MNDQKLSQIIKDVGAYTRKRIERLPPGDDRAMGWACVLGGLIGAAFNDTYVDWRVVDMIETVLAQKELFRGNLDHKIKKAVAEEVAKGTFGKIK